MLKPFIEGEYCTDRGPIRAVNQDNLYFNGLTLPRDSGEGSGKKRFCGLPLLFAICDGMGGESRGDEAALVAARLLSGCQAALPGGVESAFDSYAARANEAVLRLGRAGTTLVALALVGKSATIAYLGDSRIYLCRDGSLSLLTTDHTHPRAAADGEGGSIRSVVLTRYLGIDLPDLVVRPSYYSLEIRRGDRFLLCSDGLTDALEEGEIAAALRKWRSPAKALAAAAVRAGGRDNVTAIALRLP